MRVGLTIPHFGPAVAEGAALKYAAEAETAGFDSLWLRDHLFIPPKSGSGDGTPLLDSLTTITAIAARTSRITLGTSALIPLRHPITLAQLSATLVTLFGPRFVWGVGSGNSEREFAALGLGGRNRAADVISTIGAARALWQRTGVSWHDECYDFDDVTITPRLEHTPVPFWYCANNPKSARLAAELCDGWLPGRVNLATVRKRVETIDAMVAENGRPRPTIGVVPYTTVGRTAEQALAGIDVEPLLTAANRGRFWVTPPSGRFETIDDLAGMLLHGTPEDIVAQCRDLAEVGVGHVVFDLRLVFANWRQQFDLLAEQVLGPVQKISPSIPG